MPWSALKTTQKEESKIPSAFGDVTSSFMNRKVCIWSRNLVECAGKYRVDLYDLFSSHPESSKVKDDCPLMFKIIIDKENSNFGGKPQLLVTDHIDIIFEHQGTTYSIKVDTLQPNSKSFMISRKQFRLASNFRFYVKYFPIKKNKVVSNFRIKILISTDVSPDVVDFINSEFVTIIPTKSPKVRKIKRKKLAFDTIPHCNCDEDSSVGECCARKIFDFNDRYQFIVEEATRNGLPFYEQQSGKDPDFELNVGAPSVNEDVSNVEKSKTIGLSSKGFDFRPLRVVRHKDWPHKLIIISDMYKMVDGRSTYDGYYIVGDVVLRPAQGEIPEQAIEQSSFHGVTTDRASREYAARQKARADQGR